MESVYIHSDLVMIIQNIYPDIQTIYLFGSYGSEQQRAESDVDIALLLPYRTSIQAGTSMLFNECTTALAMHTLRTVDLINLRRADTVFQNEIIRTGRILLDQDPKARCEFEMITISLYQKLQEERKEIVDQIQQSKRVYNV